MLLLVAVVNGTAAVIVAWIAYRQAQVRRDLERYNGTVQAMLAELLLRDSAKHLGE